MRCPGHAVESRVLSRYCVECGGEAYLPEKAVARPSLAVLEHDPSTLTSFLDLVCVISGDGDLHCFDLQLQLLVTKAIQQGGASSLLCAANGYLYIGTPSGVQCLDLVTLLQSPSCDAAVLTTETAVALKASGSSVYGITASDGSFRLMGWTGQVCCCEVSIPRLKDGIVALAPVGRSVLISQRAGQEVHVIDLEAKSVSRTLNCDGPIVFAAPGQLDMVLLVDCGINRQIVHATPTRVDVVVPNIPNEITWVAAGLRRDEFVWGDGSICFSRNSRGTERLNVDGNVGVAQVQDQKVWALVETRQNSAAIAFDAGSAGVHRLEPLGGCSFGDFAVSNGRVIASNGHEIRSVSLL